MFLHLSVILSTGRMVWQTPRPWQIPPAQIPHWADPPAKCMLGYGQQVGGTHPTGMQSCHNSRLI